jgi:hypothetical protein
MPQRHICFVSLKSYHLLTKDRDSMGMGGAELQGLLISRELVRRGYTVSIITFDHDPGEIEKDIPFRLIRTYDQGGKISLRKVIRPRACRFRGTSDREEGSLLGRKRYQFRCDLQAIQNADVS